MTWMFITRLLNYFKDLYSAFPLKKVLSYSLIWSSLFLFLFVLSNGLHAQQAQIDSLRRLLIGHKDNIEKAYVYKDLASKYDRVNQDSALYFADQQIKLSKKINFFKGEYAAYYSKGVSYFRKDVKDSALYYFQKSYEDALTAQDSIQANQSLGSVGALNILLGNYELALESFFARLEMLKKYPNPTAEQTVYNNMAATYDRMENYAQAIIYHHKSLKLKMEAEDTNGLMISYQNLGAAFTKLDNEDSAVYYSKKAFKIAEQLDDKNVMAATLLNVGVFYTREAHFSFDSASVYLNKSLAITREIDDKDGMARSYSNLSTINLTVKNYQKSLDLALKALPLFESLGYKNDISETVNDIALSFEKLGRYSEAYAYLRRHKNLDDSLYTEETTRAISEMQTKYETAKKDQDLAIQSAELAEKELELNEQQLLRNGAVAGAVLLGIVAFLIYRIKTKSNKEITKKNELLSKSLSEREALLKEIHHRVKNNLQIIASLLYLQSDESENLDVKRLLEEGQGRVRSMALIHQKLYENEDLKHIPFDDYLKELIGEIKLSFGDLASNIELEVEANDVFFDVDTAVPLGLIINELSTNAFKYAYAKRVGGAVFRVVLKKEGNEYSMTVSDNGSGIPDEVLNATQSSSLGLKLTRMLSDQLEGKYNFDNSNGTTFDLKFAV
ncbi:tetratricopeptide repeat-containing sensor histidine kinase [Roseivirga echinicomitans]